MCTCSLTTAFFYKKGTVARDLLPWPTICAASEAGRKALKKPIFSGSAIINRRLANNSSDTVSFVITLPVEGSVDLHLGPVLRTQILYLLARSIYIAVDIVISDLVFLRTGRNTGWVYP